MLSDHYCLHEFLCTAKLLKVAKFYSFLLSYSPNQRHDSVPLSSKSYLQTDQHCVNLLILKLLLAKIILANTHNFVTGHLFCKWCKIVFDGQIPLDAGLLHISCLVVLTCLLRKALAMHTWMKLQMALSFQSLQLQTQRVQWGLHCSKYMEMQKHKRMRWHTFSTMMKVQMVLCDIFVISYIQSILCRSLDRGAHLHSIDVR